MMMTTRQVAKAEAHLLKGTACEDIWDRYDPRQVRVMVVEDDNGKVVGTLAHVTTLEIQGLWLDDTYRDLEGGPKRQLMREIRTEIEEGNCMCFSDLDDPMLVKALVDYFKAKPFMGVVYRLPVVKR